jgi:SAM-dependent methyltransferase
MPQSEYAKMFEAETSYFWFRAKYGLVKHLTRKLPLGKDAKILDLGCGTGINLKSLAGLGFAVGLDFFPEALSYCRKRSLQELVLSKGEFLPFREQSFDLVTSLDTIEHCQEPEKMLSEVFRSLKPGGYFLLTAPAHPLLFGAHDYALGHKVRFTRRSLRRLLEESGFKIEFCGNYFGLVFPAALLLKLYQKKFGSKSETISYRLPFALNQLLLLICELETRIFPYLALPFGTSLVALGRRIA